MSYGAKEIEPRRVEATKCGLSTTHRQMPAMDEILPISIEHLMIDLSRLTKQDTQELVGNIVNESGDLLLPNLKRISYVGLPMAEDLQEELGDCGVVLEHLTDLQD